jgi:hypothetical protein
MEIILLLILFKATFRKQKVVYILNSVSCNSTKKNNLFTKTYVFFIINFVKN